ncbi:hypothetical protein BDZ89DRAFT_1072183 [Hymenopellis radicata]|nr:hypothetical protein BDZ89DRAFT_1072183 [Hymenopellis radicata]
MQLYLFLLTFGALVCGGTNTVSDDKRHSTVECWRIEPGFQVSNVPGIVGDQVLQLGSVDNASLVNIPEDDGKPNNEGLHNAVHPASIVVLAGRVDVTVPDADCFTVEVGGVYFITDVAGTGHQSVWEAGSVFIIAPFANGVPIGHTIVANHACEDM